MKRTIAIVCIVALALGAFLIAEPIFNLSGFGVNLSVGYEEIDEGVITVVRIFSAMAVACVIVGLVRPEKLWGVPAIALGMYTLLCVGTLLMDTGKILDNAYVDYALDQLAIECNASGALWLLVIAELVAVVCGIGMMLDLEQGIEWPSLELCGYFVGDVCGLTAGAAVAFVVVPMNLNALIMAVSIVAAAGIVASGINYLVWQKLGKAV